MLSFISVYLIFVYPVSSRNKNIAITDFQTRYGIQVYVNIILSPLPSTFKDSSHLSTLLVSGHCLPIFTIQPSSLWVETNGAYVSLTLRQNHTNILILKDLRLVLFEKKQECADCGLSRKSLPSILWSVSTELNTVQIQNSKN